MQTEKTSFVNSGNTMNEIFQRTDTVIWINHINIVNKEHSQIGYRM